MQSGVGIPFSVPTRGNSETRGGEKSGEARKMTFQKDIGRNQVAGSVSLLFTGPKFTVVLSAVFLRGRFTRHDQAIVARKKTARNREIYVKQIKDGFFFFS